MQLLALPRIVLSLLLLTAIPSLGLGRLAKLIYPYKYGHKAISH